MSTLKSHPNGFLLSLSLVLIVAGIAAAIIYPRVGLERFDTQGARAKAIYWAAMCALGVVVYVLGLVVRKPAEKGPGMGKVIIGGIVAALGLGFTILSAPVVMKAMQD